MRLHPRTWLAVASLATLAACTGGAGSGDGSAGGTPRAFSRTDSDVTVLPNLSGTFTATRTVTISNDDGGAAAAHVALTSDNAGLSVSASSGGYQIQVALTATAPTEQRARDELAAMTVSHRDALDPGTLFLDTDVHVGNAGANATRSATATASLPPALAYRLLGRSDNGSVDASGLAGPVADLSSANASVTLAGTWDSAGLHSANGSVSATVDAATVQAASGNGTVQVALTGTRGSIVNLDTGNGSIDAKVSRTLGSVYDLDAQTDLGSATVSVAGTQPVGSQTPTHAHYRSADYSTGAPKVKVTGRSSIGSVTIHD